MNFLPINSTSFSLASESVYKKIRVLLCYFFFPGSSQGSKMHLTVAQRKGWHLDSLRRRALGLVTRPQSRPWWAGIPSLHCPWGGLTMKGNATPAFSVQVDTFFARNTEEFPLHRSSVCDVCGDKHGVPSTLPVGWEIHKRQ